MALVIRVEPVTPVSHFLGQIFPGVGVSKEKAGHVPMNRHLFDFATVAVYSVASPNAESTQDSEFSAPM